MKRFIFILCAFLLLALTGCNGKVMVSFETNGAQEIASREVNKGEKFELPNVSKEGYTLDGWFTDKDFTKPYKNQGIEEDTKLYAKWTIIKFTVKFVDHDGTRIGPDQQVEYGASATAPANPTRVGYTFKEWDKNFTNITSDLEVKAIYNIKSYVVKFLDHDGTELKSVTVEHGSQATAPEAPTRVGHTFKEWDKPLTNVTSNLEINAVYEINKYTVKFFDYDGTQIGDDQIVEYGASAIAPTPTREGYNFKSWDKDFSNVTEDLSVTASYEVKVFKVEFRDFDGNKIGDVQMIEYGNSATAPASPEKVGYIFTKWNQDFVEVKSNLIIIPVYTYQLFNIKYYDGETLLDHIPSTFTINEAPVLSTYEKDGFTFIGWYSSASLSEDSRVDSIAKGTTQDVTLYGKWLDNNKKFTINYELNGGKWSYDIGNVTAPGSGIDAISDLPEMFMQDFYTYLKDNNLLTSSVVATKLQKTNWEDFKKNYNDPVAIYNHTSTNTATANDGYSQFFYTTATGNSSTNTVTSIEGGFFGTEPYKTKYANLVNHLALMITNKYSGYNFWDGASAKSLLGFIIDGYFYGTQGAGTGNLLALRSVIPTPKTKYMFSGTTLKAVETNYETITYLQGLEAKLVSPFKLGYSFGGWYDNPEFTGEKVTTIPADVTPATTYYARWIELN